MIAPANGLLRLTRAVAFASVAVVLSLVGHVAAGGRSPGTGTVLVLTAICVLPAIWLTSRRRRLPSLVAALAVGQLGLHHAFMALSGTSACHASGGGHQHGAVAISCTGMPGMAPTGEGSHVAPAMLLAHALATVALAALLAHGERVVWELRAWLRTVIPLPPGAPSAKAATHAGSATTWVSPLRWRAAAGSVSRRGPPGTVAAPA
jgi:hypothetical protein